MSRAALIVNPYASRVTESLVREVRELLPGRPEVMLTRERGHATALAAAAVEAGADKIYIFSGDGGFNEVLNGIDASTPVGFLPGGGTSVLTRALGLPRDPLAAARRLARGDVRRITVGRVGARRFGFSAGIGFDAEVVRRVDALGRRADGRRPGDLRFAWTLARVVAAHRASYDEALEIVGLGRAAFAFVANCDPYSYAGAIPLHLAPGARFELGLDVVAPRTVRPRDVPVLALRLLRGRGGDSRLIQGHDLGRVEIVCDRPLPLQVDGEDLGDVGEMVVEAERDAVAVLV